ncbi:helix-turn-helix domain-containing protein [Paraburkholderia bannensis]|uniref:helix-turn-helix domain-containing protein n=1 Tax=Paraburkholderia bannensis TaxID=765414 RepID=UPI002AB16FF7|nr:helix-turn-helix domain-containing protein [Paraburkholderia bannensis]
MLVAIQQAMCEHRGNVAAVARQLRISRTTVYARLRQLRDVGMSTGSDEFSVVAQSAGEI